MRETAQTRVRIEIDPRSQPITGWLKVKGEPKRDFVGMLELISLVEAVRERPTQALRRPRTTGPG